MLSSSTKNFVTAKAGLKQKPSELIQKQISGNILEDFHQKPKIVQFLNLSDFSIYTDSKVPVDEPLFEPIPPLIQFTDFEPLQIKEKIFKLRNKDNYARRVKIIQPDSRLFQVLPANNVVLKKTGSKETNAKDNDPNNIFGGNKVAPGIDITFIIRFSPEAKIDYSYDLVVVTEREKFIVPIVAVGKRAMIDFPDILDFGNCPVKYITEKPVIIRNLGEKTTKWFLKLPAGFDANKKEGVLEYGKNEQIVINFFPMEAKTYKNEISLSYDGLDAYIQIMGVAHNGNVYLSKSFIQMDDAYIGLQTQQTLQIINKSNVKVDFQWRAFATEKEEQEKKNKIRVQLDQEEAEEKMLLKEIVSNEVVQEEIEIEDQDDSEEEERDEKALMLKRQKKAELLLARKYKNIRKAIEDDQLLFQDDIFNIEPQNGQIWPNSEMTVTVTFLPQGALHYSCTAFCNISCSADRLPLHLSGEGIGPKAYLSMVERSLGDVFVTQNKPTDIIIENKGEIEAKFELIPNETPFGKMFHFELEKGTLGVGERIPFRIDFCSTILGEFSETFKWKLEGSTETLSILFTGHVIAPTFYFSREDIDFERVSYSFPKTKKILMYNSSEVPFTFQLKIPGDGKIINQKEFEIKPNRDTILPKDQKEIAITLVSQMPRVYKMVMVVDIVGVGQDMLSIPILGVSEVPEVEIDPSDHLDFGDIFLNFPDKSAITLRNKNTLEARYEILPQNDESKILAEYTVDKLTGIINPEAVEIITVTLITKKLREITLPLQVNIVGNTTGNPHTINIIANSIGPNVEIDQKELDFKTVEVLKPVSQKFKIHNTSSIEADFHAFTRNKNSIFKPIQKHHVLKPKETVEIEVFCTADNAAVFTDILHFVIKDGVNKDVLLKARGEGTTLFWKEDLSHINFGPQFTYRLIPREIFVENKGSKIQNLRWQNIKGTTEKKKTKEDDPKKKKQGNEGEIIKPNYEDGDIFHIIPEKVTLPPKSGIMFQFHCYSTRLGNQKSTWKLNVSIGNDRKENCIVTSVLEGTFINPSVAFSSEKLYFKYSWAKNVPLMPISKTLDITCNSELPTRFLLKYAPPFSINKEEFSLLPGKSSTVRIEFDPGLKTDRISDKIMSKLMVEHIDHTYKQHVDLIGELCFPNVKLSSDMVYFGSILSETSKKQYLTMKNISEMAINYEWSFLEEELLAREEGTSQELSTTKKSIKPNANKEAIPINEIFDILPLSGHLQPGEEDQVEFIFNAVTTNRFKTKAVCNVEGGPPVEVTLLGDASLIHYKINPSNCLIDIQDVKFCDWTHKEFTIDNTGKVLFEFNINTSMIIRKGLVEVTPSSGVINGGSKQKFNVRVCPGMPNELNEQFTVEIGYYEPQVITITGRGVSPALLITLPRLENPGFLHKLEEERGKLSEEAKKMLTHYYGFIEKQRKTGPPDIDHIALMEKAKNNALSNMGAASNINPETLSQEIEYQSDRVNFCEKIIKSINDFANSKAVEAPLEKVAEKSAMLKKGSNTELGSSTLYQTMTKNDMKFLDKIVVATYVCDFGNIVVNSSKKRTFKIVNYSSQLPLEFAFESKYYKSHGFSINAERIKIPPSESQTISITYVTKKKSDHFGKIEPIMLPIDVKHGPRYMLQLQANITIPEIKIENEVETFDFGRVLIGQRKTIYLRFINEKEVACDWNLSSRQDITGGDREKEARFLMEPTSGSIPSLHKEIVKLSFIPSAEKPFQHRFTIMIKENSTPKLINVKGLGTTINLEFSPLEINIGPVLPYENCAYGVLQVVNPSDYPTEVVSLDFDEEVYKEVEALNKYGEFESQEVLFFPVREPGGLFWDFVTSANVKKAKKEELEKRIAEPTLQEEEKTQILKQLEEFKDQSKVEYPEKVEEKDLHHVIIYGPKGVGKTHLAKYLAREQKRSVVNMSDLLEWNLAQKTKAAERALKYLEERNKDLESIKADREKIIKKAGKKAKQKEEELGPLEEGPYFFLSEEILVDLVQERIKHPECNAGAIFDNLQAKEYPNELIAIKVIIKALKEHKVQLVLIEPQNDEAGFEVDKVIEWDGMEKAFQEKAAPPKKKNARNTSQPATKEKESDKNIKNSKESKEKRKASVNAPHEKKSTASEEAKEDPLAEPALFEIYHPRTFESVEEKESWASMRGDIVDLMQLTMKETMKEKLEIPKPADHLVEEKKVEEKKKPDPKKKKKQEEEEPEVIPPNPLEILANSLQDGRREVTTIPLHFNLDQLGRTGMTVVQKPIYPDKDLLPVPEPIFNQIMAKPALRNRKEPNAHFSIMTPKLLYKDQYDELYQKKKSDFLQKLAETVEADKEKDPALANELPSKQIPIEFSPGYDPSKETELQNIYHFHPDDLILDKTVSRWIVPSKRTLLLVVRFFTKSIGQFDAKLAFEAMNSVKKYEVAVSGRADFPSISTFAKSIYWSVKKNRPAQPPESYLSKVYVSSEGVFDFGPLLMGKNPANRNTAAVKAMNSTTFRITNQGKFDCELQFDLLSSILSDQQEYKKDIFFFEPDRLSLKVNDLPAEVRVWALPTEAKKYRDDLIIMIKDNPSPFTLPMICLGQRPIIEILEGENLVFDRMLLKQSGTKEIRLRNASAIPVKWKLVGLQSLSEEFVVNNTSGELKPCQESRVEVTFKALKQSKFKHFLTLEVVDAEGLGIKQDNKTINIDAEAFNISVEFRFPNNNDEFLLDFGSVRVYEVKEAFFAVKNTGLYKVKFGFNIKKKQFRECFKLEPAEAELDPGQEKQVSVKFSSKSELKLKTTSATTDMILEILEGKTLEVFKPVPINVAVNAVFSKYSILPYKNINFGPLQFNDTKNRQFTIKNEGIFEFAFTIYDYLNEEAKKIVKAGQDAFIEELKGAAAAATSKDPKKDPKAAAKEVKKPAGKDKKGQAELPFLLKIGQWSISPCKGSIPPESSCTVDVTFSGSGQKIFEQKLGVDILGRDPSEGAEFLYDVIAESCIPGINTENFDSIFEEQIVVPSLISGSNIASYLNSNVFSIEEKIFYFGTLVPSKNPDGMVEKFKISNPNKIPCNVKFETRKKTNNPAETLVFEVEPKNAKINPHDHIYVKVLFKPTIMASYNAVFEAVVENGEQNPRTHKLLFDLRGEGALPTLKLEKPKELLDGVPVLRFPRTRVDKTSVNSLMLKNDGQVPATVKFEVSPNENFRFAGQISFSLLPKTAQLFNVEFKPKSQGAKNWQISMQTLNNPYELTKVAVLGEGFYEEVTFENLPDELEDEVNLGDCIIGMEKKVVLSIKNNSNNQIRFAWNSQGNDDFSFTPRLGHLNAHASKSVTLTFKSPKTNIYKNFALLCEVVQILQSGGQFRDWDDGMTIVRYVTKTEFDWLQRKREEEAQRRKQEELEKAAALAKQKPGAKKPAAPEKKKDKKLVEKEEEPMPVIDPKEDANIPLEDPLPEPDNQQVDKSDKTLTLKTSANSDYARYESEVREIFFKPTLMYTSRSFQFKVRNTSNIKMKFNCKLTSADTGAYDPGYYLVAPKTGTIASNCDEVFTVKFSPTEVEESNARLLIIQIENLDPSQQKLIIELDGETERPMCHFELPPSTFRAKKPDLDQKFSIVEFESLGTKIKNVKRFYVVNPTNQGYEFEWKRIEEDKLPAGANPSYSGFFKSVISKGVILSGKKFEMIFEYSPETTGVHESYWTFEIPSEKIIHYFLVVGTVKEANVFIDVGKVNFGPLLLGGKNKEVVKLKNLDDIPIPFYFDRESIRGDPEFADSLFVSPVSGVVKENSEIPIEITFIPKVEREFNYNLLCNIKRKSRPISLNVKGIGYILHHQVFYDGNSSVPLNPAEPKEIIDFGDIFINEKKVRKMTIENKGDFNFDFTVKKATQLSFITITPEIGTVKKNDKKDIEILFAPIAEFRFKPKQSIITLSIVSGPTYTFEIWGNARKPGVELSFIEYNFGPCFVLRQPLPIVKELEIRNRDNGAMSVETSFEKKQYLDFQLASGQVLLPLQYEKNTNKELNVLRIPVVFTPREFMSYDEIVSLDINNLYKLDLRIQGEGIQFKLELERTEDQHVDFGIVKVGQDITRTVSLVNFSKKAININLDCSNQLQELRKNFITVFPQKEFSIQPRERREIEIRFNPKSRLHQFKEEIFYKIVENNEVRKLLNIMGSCHGVELKLMEENMAFGSVVVNSKLTKQLQLANLGDIGSKFNWDLTFCRKFFTILPESGFLAPHEDIFFEVTFHPNVIDNDIQFKKVKCNIEDSEPLFINLMGKCVQQPKEMVNEIKMEAVVRTVEKKKTPAIKNPTSKPWTIKAIISTNSDSTKGCFEGKESLDIPANGSAEYEISYKPLTMTKNPQFPEIKEEFHEGTLFFPLPDGTAMMFSLVGTSKPPGPTFVPDCNIKAKKAHLQILPLKNWLKVVQRFNVTWQFDTDDPTIFVNCANTIDISESSKDYKLTIFALKQTMNKLTVTFKNPLTSEFIFYKFGIVVSPPDPIGKIDMLSVVRETFAKLITIENPLNVAVTIKKENLIADHECITFNPPTFVMPPKSESGFEVVFRPLLANQFQSKFRLSCPELGEFIYLLNLTGLPTTIPRSMIFKTSLGTDIVQNFKFTHYLKKATEYQCKIEKIGGGVKPPEGKPGDKKAIVAIDFTIDNPVVKAPPAESFEGTDLTINIRFEPSSLIESRAMLTIASNEGGEYTCLLIGQSSAPQPKGPHKVGGAKPPPIEFKNPFFETLDFIIRTDNPSFTTSVKNPLKLEPKKSTSIQVSYKAVPNTSLNGRLIISTDRGDVPPWVFYLQGE